MPSAWNQDRRGVAASLVVRPVHGERTANAATRAFAVAAASALAAQYGPDISLNVWGHLASVRLLLGLAAAILALYGACILQEWRRERLVKASQDKLPASQRKLLGLPPAEPKPHIPAQLKPNMPGLGPPATQTPMVLPQRFSRTPQALAPGADAGYVESRTPLTSSTHRSRLSPASAYSAPGTGLGATLATPEQLRSYLDCFSHDVAAAAAAGGQATPRVGLHSMFAGIDTLPDQAGGLVYGAAPDMADLPSNVVLPASVEPPKYCPSWLPRTTPVAQQQAGPDVLVPSSSEDMAAFLARVLRARQEWLELWTERLREWMATRMLQPLMAAVEAAHTPANAVLARYGQSSFQLPPLLTLLGMPQPNGLASEAGMGANAAGSSLGSAGRTPLAGRQQQAGSTVDLEALLQHLKQLAAAMAATSQPQQAQDAAQLQKALSAYEALMLLLRGRRPGDLLPPAPAGYILARIQALAEGSCMPAFNWNGGGPWAGRAWSSDLPTDSSLVVYLFAAYLDVPGWQFDAASSSQAPAGSSSSGLGHGRNFFVGTLPARPPAQYSAVLAYRPDKPGKDVDALLMLSQHGSGAPGAMLGATGGSLFCFMAEERLMVLSGYKAVFHAILLFLLFHKAKYDGAVGMHFLQDQAMGLASVIEPPPAGSGMTPQQHVWGWWFPPGHDKAQ